MRAAQGALPGEIIEKQMDFGPFPVGIGRRKYFRGIQHFHNLRYQVVVLTNPPAFFQRKFLYVSATGSLRLIIFYGERKQKYECLD
jgi:hypothetical protein